MRRFMFASGALLLLACVATEPRDLSNATATLADAEPRIPANIHAVREVVPTPFVATVLAQSDRTAADRALDARKQAADLLTYVDPHPGMRVAELGCGGGYFTELLARAVGPDGAVLAQNSRVLMSPAVLDAWGTRLARPSMAKVVSYDRPFADPLPPDARGLDLVYLGAYYGLLAKYGVDRDAMNHKVHFALAPNGHYVVIDWALPDGGSRASGAWDAHRQRSRSTRREIESAGFVFESEGRFLRTSPYANDWDAAEPNALQPRPPRLHKDDVFVLVFFKP